MHLAPAFITINIKKYHGNEILIFICGCSQVCKYLSNEKHWKRVRWNMPGT